MRASDLVPAGLVLALACSNVDGQQDNRERDALNRMRQQVVKAREENAALKREKDELESKLRQLEANSASLKTQLGKARRDAGGAAAAAKQSAELRARLLANGEKLKQADAGNAQLQAEADTLRTRLDEAEARAARMLAEASATENRLDNVVAQQSGRADACEAKNAELYAVTMDLIGKYKENRGRWEKFLLSEPFTRMKSVEVENLLEDAAERAEDARIAPGSKR